MGFIKKMPSAPAQISERQRLSNKYSSACHNILLVLAFTAINLILLVANSNSYFLFSAYIPYALADIGMFLCGMYPAEYYAEFFPGMEFLPKGVFVVTLAIAVVILVLYVLCWIFARKFKSGWLITALVLFSIDTVVLLIFNGIMIDFILDYVFHAWVIFSLINGLVAYTKLKKLPAEEERPVAVPVLNDEPVAEETQPLE